MRAPRFVESLRGKILIAVLVCAVAPLAALGAWLTSSAARSGELLLRSQLDTTVERVQANVQERWRHRRSDASLLANNEPIRTALRASGGNQNAPSFVRQAFETMPGITGVVVRDARGRARWTLGEIPASRVASAAIGEAGVPIGATYLTLRVPVHDDSSGETLGDVFAFVRFDALFPPLGVSPSSGAPLIAVLDRSNGTWHRPATLPPLSLDARSFTWENQRWSTVRRSMDAPPLDIVVAAPLDPFVRPFAHTAVIGATAVAIVAIAVIALTILVTGRLTRSLGQLAEAADAVSRGALDERIEVQSADEVGRVARTFNSMSQSIRRMMSELSQREAVAAMGELAATLAHQVRSPVTAMRLDVERVQRRLGKGSPDGVLLGRALEQLDRLERAVHGSLKVAGSARADFRSVDVREPLARAIAGSARDSDSRQVRIDSSLVTGTALLLQGDAPSLEQLFANILANAVQAARPGGVVSVAAESMGNGNGVLRVIIRDDGVGIPKDVLGRVGEPFFSTKPEGTGLGLVIAKRIAAAHRGTLTIDSGPGSGTIVSIEFPVPSGFQT